MEGKQEMAGLLEELRSHMRESSTLCTQMLKMLVRDMSNRISRPPDTRNMPRTEMIKLAREFIERERALLPEHQGRAERVKRLEDLANNLKSIAQEIDREVDEIIRHW